MSHSPVYNLLKEAVTALSEYRIEDVQKMLDEPYQQAIKAETDNVLKEKAASLYNNLKLAVSEPVKDRMSMNKISQYVVGKFNQEDLSGVKQVEQASSNLHQFIHNISETRLQQAKAFTQHESELLDSMSTGGWVGKIKGAVQYNVDVAKRRWGDDLGKEVTLKTVKEAVIDTPSDDNNLSVSSLLSNNSKSYFENLEKNSSKPDLTVTIEEGSLEEFGGVKHLDTPLKRAGAIAVGALGAGLAVHGVRNMYLSFNPEANKHLELDEESAQKDGINWTRLAVGAAEAVAGSAIIYRTAIGKWSAGVVEGKAEALLDCNHTIGR